MLSCSDFSQPLSCENYWLIELLAMLHVLVLLAKRLTFVGLHRVRTTSWKCSLTPSDGTNWKFSIHTSDFTRHTHFSAGQTDRIEKWVCGDVWSRTLDSGSWSWKSASSQSSQRSAASRQPLIKRHYFTYRSLRPLEKRRVIITLSRSAPPAI